MHFGFACIRKAVCVQLQCAVTCTDKYLHTQRLHTLMWGFAYTPSHQHLISAGKGRMAVSDFMHTDVHIKKIKACLEEVF